MLEARTLPGEMSRTGRSLADGVPASAPAGIDVRPARPTPV